MTGAPRPASDWISAIARKGRASTSESGSDRARAKHLGVLTNLERREMEAEGLGLPRQVAASSPSASRSAPPARRDSRRTSRSSTERGRGPIALRSSLARGHQPFSDEGEPRRCGASGSVRASSRARSREERGVAREGASQRRRGGDVQIAGREGARDPPGGGLVPSHDMVVRDARRRQRHVGRDGGVAVTIAADPRGPSE